MSQRHAINLVSQIYYSIYPHKFLILEKQYVK